VSKSVKTVGLMGIHTKLDALASLQQPTPRSPSSSSTLPLHSHALGYPQASQKIATLGCI